MMQEDPSAEYIYETDQIIDSHVEVVNPFTQISSHFSTRLPFNPKIKVEAFLQQVAHTFGLPGNLTCKEPQIHSL